MRDRVIWVATVMWLRASGCRKCLTIQTADGEFAAYVARPDHANAPAIVVIQEIFGVNAVMRAIADKFAAAGFLAICPDLFWRIEPGIDITDGSEAEWKRAFELYNACDVDNSVRDLAATITAARSHPACSGKVGSVGFCLGGLLAYLTATRTDVDAAVGYYGVGIERFTAEAGGLSTPLVLHIAEEDQFVDHWRFASSFWSQSRNTSATADPARPSVMAPCRCWRMWEEPA